VTQLSSSEHADVDWSWLELGLEEGQDPGAQSLKLLEQLPTCTDVPRRNAHQMSLDQPLRSEACSELNHFEEHFASNQDIFFPEAIGVALSTDPPDATFYGEIEDLFLPCSNAPFVISGFPLLESLPPTAEENSSRTSFVPPRTEWDHLQDLNDAQPSRASSMSIMTGSPSILEDEQSWSQYQADPLVVDKSCMNMEDGEDVEIQLPYKTKSLLSSVLSVTSLSRRLSQGSHNHSTSTLEDIASLMEHFTISTSSAASSSLTRLSRAASSTNLPILDEDVQLPNKIEYPVMLPGTFPEYCWEQINNNNLRRCNRGQKYRKAKPICTHRGPRSNPDSPRVANYTIPHYHVYNGPKGEKVDCFGNSALHIAAALAAPPQFLIELIESTIDVHTLNNGGETFLHLVHPESDGFCHWTNTSAKPNSVNDICELLVALKLQKFKFDQQDSHGRTSLHWLARPSIPHYVVYRIRTTIQRMGINVPSLRDNLGLTITAQIKDISLPSLNEKHENDRAADVTDLTLENELFHDYKNNTVIETVEDLRRYEIRADLLRTIKKSEMNPEVEDGNGRNGLHCLAEVSFDLISQKVAPVEPDHSKRSSKLPSQHEQHLRRLLQSNVDINSYDKDGTTPLMAFVIHTRASEDEASTIRILKRLLEAGSDTDRRNRKGETALHIAVKLGRKTATTVLLKEGANVHARTRDGLGILALGYESANKAKYDETLYAQIMLCITLVANAGAVSAPTILQEWGFVRKGFVRMDTESPPSGFSSID
jgi:ankyrin repeat protein